MICISINTFLNYTTITNGLQQPRQIAFLALVPFPNSRSFGTI